MQLSGWGGGNECLTFGVKEERGGKKSIPFCRVRARERCGNNNPHEASGPHCLLSKARTPQSITDFVVLSLLASRWRRPQPQQAWEATGRDDSDRW